MGRDDRGKMRVSKIICRLSEVDEMVRKMRRKENVGMIEIKIRIERGKKKEIMDEMIDDRWRNRDDIEIVEGIIIEFGKMLMKKIDIVEGGIGRNRNLKRMRK